MKENQTQQYIITEDAGAILSAVNPAFETGLEGEIEQYFSQLTDVLRILFQDRVDVVSYKLRNIEERLESRVGALMEEDIRSVCICLDRYLLAEFEQRNPERFFRFGICRTNQGDRVPRQQTPPFDVQFAKIASAVPDIGERRTIVVDDGLFTGGTVKEFVNMAKARGLPINVTNVVGFVGDGTNPLGDRVSIDTALRVGNLFDWVDQRDFTPFGGKQLASGRRNMVTSAVPYIYPWSDGSSASLDMEPCFFSMSECMLTSFQKLVRSLENRIKRKLTFRDFVSSGFPFPTDIKKTLPVSLNTNISDYIAMCREKIWEERDRNVTIFDMDGTLYQLDGENNGFSGSTLERSILENALRFVMEKEECSSADAEGIINEGIRNPIGLSKFLANRYSISRSDYFNRAWDINPEGVVSYDQELIDNLRQLVRRNPGTKYVLVSSAPAIWVGKVLEYLGIKDCFELCITAEKFGSKDEVFRMFAVRYYPGSVISIGDQEKTDIIPAQKLGMTAYKVNGPSDTTKVIMGM